VLQVVSRRDSTLAKIWLIKEDALATTSNRILEAFEALALCQEIGCQISMLFQVYSHPIKEAG